MPNTPSPFQIDPALTAIAVNYRNSSAMLIADEVLPRVPVMSEEFKWTWYPPEESFTVPDTLVGRKGRVTEVEFTGEERVGSVKDYGLEDVIPMKDIDRARDMRAQRRSTFSPVDRATEALTDLLLLDREVRVAAKVFDPAVYDADKKVALSGTSRFSDFAGSDPIGVIGDALDATFIMRPNVAVMGRSVWSKLSTHPDVVKAAHGNSGDKGRATRQQVAELFELDEILVGESFVNTARKGQAATMSRVWGKHISLIHRNRQADSGRGVTFGYTAEYGGRMAGQWFDRNRGLKGAQVIRVGEQVDEIIAAPAVGYLIENAVA